MNSRRRLVKKSPVRRTYLLTESHGRARAARPRTPAHITTACTCGAWLVRDASRGSCVRSTMHAPPCKPTTDAAKLWTSPQVKAVVKAQPASSTTPTRLSTSGPRTQETRALRVLCASALRRVPRLVLTIHDAPMQQLHTLTMRQGRRFRRPPCRFLRRRGQRDRCSTPRTPTITPGSAKCPGRRGKRETTARV